MRSFYLAISLLAGSATALAQGGDRELVAVITGPALKGGIVSALSWDGGTLVIQTAAMDANGVLKPSYFRAPGKGMDLIALPSAPAAVDHYWKLKSSRTSPTGLGQITSKKDAKMPVYGVGSLERRVTEAAETGGTDQLSELRLRSLVIHSRAGDVDPYDGEVWSWSPAELNRIAYVDGKGDLYVATAEGRNAERLQKGHFTLPAWSEDGRTLAVAERKDDGRKWEVSVIHLPSKLRQ